VAGGVSPTRREIAPTKVVPMAKDRSPLAIGAAIAALLRSLVVRSLVADMFDAYRPERHYMRGPGPKWRAKRGFADGTT
jgi:hypothetical protein